MINLVKGKKKKGGLIVHKGTNLAEIVFESDERFIYKSPIKAKLIEVNPKIMKMDFEVINKFPEEDGYFFIMDLPHNDISFP